MIHRNNPVAGEFYRHFKGRLYQIIGIAKHSETGEQMVVYQALYGDYGLYTRPLDMFMSPVDKVKYPEIVQEFRFEKVMPEAEDDVVKKTAGDMLAEEIQNICPQAQSTAASENEETVREEILRFLDAEGAGEKLEVLRELRKKMDENLLTTIELSLDLLPDERESMERRYELVEQTLEKRVRFEGGRLR